MFSYYTLLDKADALVEPTEENLVYWVMTQFSKLKYYWDNFTILSIVLIVFILFFITFIIQHSISHRRMISRAFWRGWRLGYKQKFYENEQKTTPRD